MNNWPIIRLPLCNNPEHALMAHLGAAADADRPHIVVIPFRLTQFWLQPPTAIELVGVYCIPADTVSIRAFVTDKLEELERRLPNVDVSTEKQFAAFAASLSAALIAFDKPLRLQTVSIPKPWGQEIWYTGIEARGVAQVLDSGDEQPVEPSVSPLPWVLTLGADQLLADAIENLVLLKILDPLPAPVYGDLYFELHQEKREVYVVTAIDDQAWPEGVGAIRFGFDPESRQRFGDDSAFKEVFKQAVKAYEAVRREIDKIYDQRRLSAGLALDEPVPVPVSESWRRELPDALRQREEQLREAMNAFTQLLPLRVGDVVKVPCLTPHALQHGVRAVEFQTPVYERKILAFAQKVLTQAHWDTDAGVELMEVDTPRLPTLHVSYRDDQVSCERVVDFEDFEVDRVRIRAGGRYRVVGENRYWLCMTIAGTAIVGGCYYRAEQCCLLPACQRDWEIGAGEQDTLILLARPCLKDGISMPE